MEDKPHLRLFREPFPWFAVAVAIALLGGLAGYGYYVHHYEQPALAAPPAQTLASPPATKPRRLSETRERPSR